MDLKLQGNVVVVLGGASGIGLAIGRAASQEGAIVALADRSPTVAERAADLFLETGCRAVGHVLDVTDCSAVERYAASLEQAEGRVDHVVYAAGMGSGKFGFPFWNLSPSDWPRVLDVNLVGAVNAAHAFAPKLAAARSGTLLFISSVAAQIGSQTDPPYSAAKAALINFAQCAAKDLAPYDVRVNVICPGMVQTPLNRAVWQAWHDSQPLELRRSYDDWAGEKVKKVAPLGRWQTPEDIAALAVFLASPQARNITGQTMNVDGGQVMH
ncbi:MAG: SDR family oxidoreductase [Pirellulales bacterium]